MKVCLIFKYYILISKFFPDILDNVDE